MQGDALEWWAGVRYNILTYAAFQAGVKARFGESESLLMTKVMNIKQNKEETVRHYVDRFRRLVIQAGYPDAGRNLHTCTLEEAVHQWPQRLFQEQS